MNYTVFPQTPRKVQRMVGLNLSRDNLQGYKSSIQFKKITIILILIQEKSLPEATQVKGNTPTASHPHIPLYSCMHNLLYSKTAKLLKLSSKS